MYDGDYDVSSIVYEMSCYSSFCRDTTSYACGAFDVQTLFPVDEPSLILAEISNDPSVRTIAEFRPAAIAPM
jgi:hypothetical protein